jgi:hypothetical protein
MYVCFAWEADCDNSNYFCLVTLHRYLKLKFSLVFLCITAFEKIYAYYVNAILNLWLEWSNQVMLIHCNFHLKILICIICKRDRHGTNNWWQYIYIDIDYIDIELNRKQLSSTSNRHRKKCRQKIDIESTSTTEMWKHRHHIENKWYRHITTYNIVQHMQRWQRVNNYMTKHNAVRCFYGSMINWM